MGDLVELRPRVRSHGLRPYIRQSDQVAVLPVIGLPVRSVLERAFPDSEAFVEYVSSELMKHNASVKVAELFIEALHRSIDGKQKSVARRFVTLLSDPERDIHTTSEMRKYGEQFARALRGLEIEHRVQMRVGESRIERQRSVDLAFTLQYVQVYYRALAMILES